MNVTVIIPCGGTHSKMVSDAVQSCLKVEVPVIVIDDISIPPVRLGTSPLVSLHRLPVHRGRSYARNFGAKLAETEWLYFLDSDDMIEPTAIEDFRAVADSCDISYADYDYVDAAGERVRVEKHPYSYSLTSQKNLVNIGMFVRRDRFEKIGGFDEDMQFGEYWDFFLRHTANPKIRVHKNARPYFVARPASVNPDAQRLLQNGSLKIQAMIRGGYYREWRTV